MKTLYSYCLECQTKKIVIRIPTARYWAYCQDCLNQAFTQANNV